MAVSSFSDPNQESPTRELCRVVGGRGLLSGVVGGHTRKKTNFQVESLVYPRLTHARSVVLRVCARVECGDVWGMGLAAAGGPLVNNVEGKKLIE